LQVAYQAPSSEHHRVASSDELSVIDDAVWFVGDDGPEIVTTGGVVSMFQERVRGADVFPAVSVAHTDRACAPGLRPE